MFRGGGFELLAQVGERVGELHVAGVGDGECIGGVEVFGVVIEAEDGAQHGGDLLFGRIAVACNDLFDDRGFIFGVGEVAAHGCGNGDTLCASKFEHGLDIFTKERGFDGEVVGMEGVNDAEGGVKDTTDTQVEIGKITEIEDVHGKYGGTIGVEETITEYAGAGVDAKDNHGDVQRLVFSGAWVALVSESSSLSTAHSPLPTAPCSIVRVKRPSTLRRRR